MEKITRLVFKEGDALSEVMDGVLIFAAAVVGATDVRSHRFEFHSLEDAEKFIFRLSRSLNDFIDVIAEAKLHGAK